MENPVKQIVYLDLDGVIVDWQDGFKRISGGLTGDEFEVKYGKVPSMELVKKYGMEWCNNSKDSFSGKNIKNPGQFDL